MIYIFPYVTHTLESKRERNAYLMLALDTKELSFGISQQQHKKVLTCDLWHLKKQNERKIQLT